MDTGINAPSEQAKKKAADVLRALGRRAVHPPRLRIETDEGEHELPSEAAELLVEILDQIAEGHIARVVRVDGNLSIEEAADLLNVSRGHIVKLMDSGELACLHVGAHRRIPTQALLAFRRKREAQQCEAVRELTREAQALGLDYE